MPTEPEPTVSIIIPTFRRPRLLRRAILSALAQEGPPLQVCVYDNASGDETSGIVAELAARDPRVRYHCHAANMGGFNNFQYGLAHVATPFFSMLSDDDVVLPGFLQNAMRGFAQHPQAMFWAGLTVRMRADGTVYDAHAESWPREGLYEPPEGLVQMVRNKQPTWTSVLFRREVVEQIGLLDEEVHAPSDIDFLLRIAARAPYIISRQPAAIFLVNPQSFSELGPFSAYWPGWLKMIDNIIATGSLDESTQAFVIEYLNAVTRRQLFRRAANALSKPDYEFARQAAQVLQEHYGLHWRARFLKLLVAACSALPPAQQFYTWAYRTAERQMLSRRGDLQQRYGDLVRYLQLPG